jgi:hypothetical protein
VRLRANLLALLALAACRFGGPSADPDAYVASPAPDSGSKAAPADDGTDDATIATIDAPVGAPPLGDDASTDVASLPLTDDDAGSAGGCAPMVAICNPVHDTGCNPLQQCDVDTSQKTPTGICVFNSGSEGGAPCMMTIFTESCPAQSTCVNGACRALCFCDTDCPTGSCCTDTSGPAGFTLCEKCP